MIYAGIGSRETPAGILQDMYHIAQELARHRVTLRSGGAPGADQAFERGAFDGNGQSEIYLPWERFEQVARESFKVPEFEVHEPTAAAYAVANKFHPRYNYLSHGVKKLMARNSHQVLGYHLDTPADFVLCYTPGGKGSGGTGQALRIAKAYDIPVCDMGGEPIESILDFIDSKLAGG